MTVVVVLLTIQLLLASAVISIFLQGLLVNRVCMYKVLVSSDLLPFKRLNWSVPTNMESADLLAVSLTLNIVCYFSFM